MAKREAIHKELEILYKKAQSWPSPFKKGRQDVSA